jgi:hypothetical protein
LTPLSFLIGVVTKLTKILQYRISSYLEENNLIEDNQAGFRQDYRTTDEIFILKTLLNKCLHVDD